mgnify:CR=1 FL=1
MAGKSLKTITLVAVSGIGGIALFLLAVTGYLYLRGDFSEVEESTMYYDSEQQKAFIERLEADEIPFRLGPGGAVFYPVSHRDQVREVGEELRNHFGPEHSVIIVGPEQLDAAKADFEKNAIEFDVLNYEDGYMIQWGRKNNTKVAKMLKSAPYYNQRKTSGQ